MLQVLELHCTAEDNKKKWLQGKKIEVCSLFNDQQEESLDSNAGFRSYFIKCCKLCSVIKADED